MQGKTIIGYTLQRLLGVGGMAEVWYAENGIGKKAAVKLLLPKYCEDENIVARFQNEAKVMVQLDHPHIRQIYDYGEIDGQPCIVMEYLEGNDLNTLIKQGRRFTDAELRKWWDQIVDALNYTHAEGIIHRDIKPSNLFLDKKGNIKLLDFGIAKIRESISMTQTGTTMGTLMYMSPEQVDDAKHLGPATDVYSLAVSFVHLLTGCAPYNATKSSDFKIRESIVYKPLDMTGVPAEWQAFLTPYLEKDPEKRAALRPFKAVPLSESPRTFQPNSGSHSTGKEDLQSVSDDEVTLIGVTNKFEDKSIDKQQLIEEQPKPEKQDKPKSRKGLWIGLGAAVVVIAVVFAVILPRIDRAKAEEFFNEGKALYDNKEYAEALPFFEKAANKNHTEAQYYLGKMYRDSLGVEKVDNEKAAEWFLKSAKGGNAIAQYRIGWLYKYGIGVAQDSVKAIEWYSASAEQGYDIAQFNLAICYIDGMGVEKDPTKAVEWYRKAAEQGYAQAQTNLGYCYEKGQGVEIDLEEARKWYQKAVAQGRERAKNGLVRVTGDLTFTANGVSFVMKPVEGGTFKMGSNDSEASNAEKAIHDVTLSAFYMAETEVTQVLWQAVMGTTISQQRYKADSSWSLRGEGNNYPMYYVSWNECQEFINKLNSLTGKKFRLPTEAEWEFAARGGLKKQGYKYAGSNNIDAVAWYKETTNGDLCTRIVKTKQPNELGLYDMSGNVYEWCNDRFDRNCYNSSPSNNPQGPSSGSFRVFRGGSKTSDSGCCRVSYRNSQNPDSRFSDLGFRIVLPL